MSIEYTANADAAEIAKFNRQGDAWWDPQGDLRTLHALNPVRVAWIAARAALARQRVCDVGCGGGLLSEALAAAGAQVTGVDAAAEALAAARNHAAQRGLVISYRQVTAEAHALESPASYDVVCCLELLEHVPAPASLITALGQLVRPGGDVFVSTINRTPAAWGLAIVTAEYLLNLLPRGTHVYRRFVRPSELRRMAAGAGLGLQALTGIRYRPFAQRAELCQSAGTSYLAHFRRAE